MQRLSMVPFARTLAVALLGFTAAQSEAANPPSQWVMPDAQGRLTYKTLPTGDRIMDFSFAGYGGGGIALPTVPTKVTVKPTGGNDTATIQAALDQVSKLPLANGFRGAVQLAPGTYLCENALKISSSGVVLRGSGSDATTGTIIKLVGKPHVFVIVAGEGTASAGGNPTPITDAYVPAGATSLHLADANGFKVGDSVGIEHPVTPAWVKFMGMDTLVRNGKKQTWVSGVIHTQRTIRAIAGNTITFDIPLSDSLDAKYLAPPGASLVKCTPAQAISQVGLENLNIFSPPQPVSIDQPQHQAVKMQAVTDGWIRNLAITDTVGSVQINNDAKRITVENVAIKHSVATLGAAKPADFSTNGSQVLFNRCSATGDGLFYFVTGARVSGPNVLLNCVFHGNGHLQPHQRWATGLLVDSCQVPEGGIDFMNRGIMGSGHGWTIGWAVAWNCLAKSYLIQQPPGSTNWAIGCKGTIQTDSMPAGSGVKGPKLPQGIFDAHETPVTPTSLYLAQLRERLGEQAVKNIGY